MKLRSPKVEIPKGDPFKNDRLGRKPLGESITLFLENVEAPFVLSVNSPWGTGKTTFLEMCGERMRMNGLESLYLNAWSTDFAEDPLAAFVGEICRFLEEQGPDSEQAKRISKLKGVSFLLARRAIPIAAKIATIGTLDLDKEVERFLAEFAGDLAKDVTKAFDVQKSLTATFRELLQQSVEHLHKGGKVKRLVVMIDELDRCRPSYAIESLERMKHLFDVENVVFLLALDMTQLCSSVKGIYGAGVDARDYLRRFVDLEFRLPPANGKAYAKTLSDEFGIQDFLNGRKGSDVSYAQGHVVEGMGSLAEIFNMSLRTQQQCMARIKFALLSTPAGEELLGLFVSALSAMKTVFPVEFAEFINGALPAGKMIDLVRHRRGGDDFLKSNYGTAIEAYLLYVQPNETVASADRKSLLSMAADESTNGAPARERALTLLRIIDQKFHDSASRMFRSVVDRIEIGFNVAA